MNFFTMNEQNNTANTSASVVLPAKRKRGRPRKDGSVVKKGEGSLQSPSTSVSDGMRPVHQQNEAKPNDRGMVGRIVSGVIDGCFDAGYFLSVRIGNNGPPLRGVIFEPGRVTPVSSDNDVAPNAKLFQRSELPIPAPNPQCQGNGMSQQLEMEMHNVCSQVLPSKPQSSSSFMFEKPIASSTTNVAPATTTTAVNVSSNNSRPSLMEQIVMQQNTTTFGYLSQPQPVPPPQNLRMVEQDEMMQVYEVSVQSEGLMEDAVSSKDWMSESTAKLNHQVGLSPEQCSTFQIAKETATSSSDQAKQNHLVCSDLKDSFHGFHQSCLISEDQQPLVMDRRLQNEPQARIFDLHDTPIVDQTPSELQQSSPNPEIHQTSTTEKQEDMDSRIEQNKLDHYDLDRQNFGILRDLVAGNSNHFLPPEVISDHPEKFIMEKPNSPKETNNESSEIRNPGTGNEDHHVDNNDQLHSQNAQRMREATPFDLELAAEESTKFSSPTNNNPTSLSESDPPR